MRDDQLELCYLPAVEALRRFRARELSPVELLEAVIARAEEVEPVVNALCVRYFDEAADDAREAERRYAGKSEPPRPLEGLPVGIKDEMPIAGQSCSMGSLVYRDYVAEETDPMGKRILEAGAIVHARTTCPEFSIAGFTHSRLWGVTRNPWNPEFAVGGSSGGSGAALASGTAALAGGSDIGGSIRIPASFCGVVGFKPPYGRVPQLPPFNLDHYCHNGPLARTVADCLLFENVIAGPHPADPVAIRPKLELPERLDGVAGRRVAFSLDLGGYPLDLDVAENTLAAADAFREAGAAVEEVELPWRPADVTRAAHVHYGAIFGPWVARELEQHRELLTPYAIEAAEELAAAARETSFLEGLELEARLTSALTQVLERYDVLVCPTVGTRGLVAGDDYVGHGIEVGGVALQNYFHALLTQPFNVASRCPVLAVPSGFARNGVPTGIQIVGRPYDDESVFRAGAAYERVRPWLDAPERRPRVGTPSTR
jgi:aspartyl-tRNA(Asn)/glutamyl-tRNA(Gln) amidotransferase subunit A